MAAPVLPRGAAAMRPTDRSLGHSGRGADSCRKSAVAENGPALHGDAWL